MLVQERNKRGITGRKRRRRKSARKICWYRNEIRGELRVEKEEGEKVPVKRLVIQKKSIKNMIKYQCKFSENSFENPKNKNFIKLEKKCEKVLAYL